MLSSYCYWKGTELNNLFTVYWESKQTNQPETSFMALYIKEKLNKIKTYNQIRIKQNKTQIYHISRTLEEISESVSSCRLNCESCERSSVLNKKIYFSLILEFQIKPQNYGKWVISLHIPKRMLKNCNASLLCL